MLYGRKIWLFVVLMTATVLIKAVPTTFISPSQITTTPFSITAPGLYVLTDDVAYNTSGGTAITINSSDVTLDMNGKAIINTGAGVENSIALASTFTNVVIRNGTIRVFDGTGITVPTGSYNIALENIATVGVNATVGTGIDLQGIAGATTRSKGITIRNCDVRNCLRGLNGTAADNVVIRNSNFNNNGGRSILATNCNSWILDGCQASANSSATEGIGLFVIGGLCWVIKNSDFSGNTGGTGAGRGAVFQAGISGTGGHVIENNTFCFNGSGSGSSVGIDLQISNSCVFRNCIANGNFATSSIAEGYSITGSGIILEGCIGNGNIASGSVMDVYGIIISGTGCTIRNSQFSGNASTAGTSGAAVGILLSSSSRGFFIDNCVCAGNVTLGSGGPAVGFGILLITTAGSNVIKDCTVINNSTRGFDNAANAAGANLFIGNKSFGHGVAGASNYVGAIPFLSIAAAGPYPLAGSFDNRRLANLSFT